MESKNFDSEFCGNIPIITINSIQSYGFLLLLDLDFKIIQISENIERFLPYQKRDLLQKQISEIIPSETFQELKKKIKGPVNTTLPVYINFNSGKENQKYLSLIHRKPNYIILEFEPVETHETSFSEINYEIKNIAGIVRNAKSKEDVLSLACKEIKQYSGFDRVLIYQFDKNWNGTVVAEEKEEVTEFDTYLGLVFPASDIPKQARNMYLNNPFRYIPDRNYNPSVLFPEINPLINGHTDLSSCNLRGVAPVHIEYLGNMHVDSSMSIPIIRNNTLWGLVSCHHRTSRKVSYQQRSSFEILTSILSSELASRETEKELQERLDLDLLKNQLLQKLNNGDLHSALLTGSVSLLSLLNLSGATTIFDNKVSSAGITPDNEQIKKIVSWLRKQNLQTVYSTNQLPLIMEEAKEFNETASGLIVIPISFERDEYILGFRQEVIKEIKWGGNPNEAIKFEENKKDYHPRNSFHLWKETVRNTATPWTLVELETAERFRSSLIEYVLKIQTYKRVIAEEEAFKLSIVANNTTNLVLILDNRRQIEWANAAFLNTLHFKIEEIKGKLFTYLFSSFLGTGEINQRLNDIDGNYSPFSREIVINKGENNIFIKFNFSPLLNEQKELYKYVIVGVDITEIKEHANELQAINAELDRFAYLVSHDLKAPLKAIEALGNLLKSDISEGNYEEISSYINHMQLSIKKMEGFISDILEYSRIAKDKRVKSKIQLKKLIDDIIQTLNPPSTYNIYVQPDLPEIYSNNLEIFQIFSNLLSNAFKYVSRPDGKIEVYYNVLDNNYLFTVRDNGPGIKAEYKEKIFDLFETIPTENSSDGTGIGLASVKKIIQEKGGKIWVDSNPDDGSAFKFTLPIEQ